MAFQITEHATCGPEFLDNPRLVMVGSCLGSPYGNVGIGTATPRSTLQVEGNPGYLQIDTLTEAPPGEDCDEGAEVGRMVLQDPDYLWVCTSAGWKALGLG